VRVKGTVELFVPSRDPNATVKIDKALAKLDAPLSSKALKAAKVSITPMSRTGYAEAQKARKLDATKIEAIRAEAKKQGVPEAEMEMAIELAKAMESMDDDVPENAVILSGTKADFDRIFRVEILGADGKPLETSGRSTSTRGDSSVMTLMPSTPPPPNASLQIFLLTDKSRVSSPFDLNVTLP
jgi:Tfp pilus assembly protein PilN